MLFQEQCDFAYEDTNLAGDVELVYGIQIWEVPVTGLYLVTGKKINYVGINDIVH